MRRGSRLLVLAAVLVAAMGCSKCGNPASTGPSDPAELAPSSTQVALLIPKPLVVGQHAQQLTQLKLVGIAASLVGAGDGKAFLDELKRQLGFDPTSAEGFAAAGIDANAPLLTAHTAEGFDLAIVPIADAGKFDATLTRLAKDRLRAPSRSEHDGLVLFSSQGGPPVLGYARKGKFAVAAAGPKCIEAISAAAAQSKEKSLAANADYLAYAGANASRDLVVFASADSPLKQLGLPGGARMAASMGEHTGTVVVDLPLSTVQATALASLHGNAGSELVGQLDPDAFAVLRSAMDPAMLWPVVSDQLGMQTQRHLINAGVNMNDVLANVKPGAAMSLALAQNIDLARMPSFDPRETNPFRYVYLAALGHVKDPAALQKTLADLQKFGGDLGMKLEPKTLGKTPAWTFSYPLGESASLALEGDKVTVSGGKDRLEPLLTRAPGAGAKIPAEYQARFDAAGAAIYLDVSKVVAAIKTLPDSAYGLGGFAIKAAVTRWLDAVGELKNGLITVDTVATPSGSTLHLEVTAALP